MIKELKEPELAAWRLFLTAHARLITRIDQELTEADCLPLHWYDVLVELALAPGRRLRMHELADSIVLSRSGLTRLVDRLEKEEFLCREPDPADRRGTFAVLTDEGRAALRRSWPVYAKGIQVHFAQHLSDAEISTLAGALTRVLEAADER